MRSRPGRRLSSWSDPLLLLLLQHLSRGDLARCSRVCRQWYRVASDPQLQAHCLLQAWPVSRRQQLEKALACSGAQAGLSPRQLFCSQLQQRLCTDRFDLQGPVFSDSLHSDLRRLVCSPDGRYLALASSATAADGSAEVRLWRYGRQGLHCLGQFRHPGEPCHLRFGADSRSLRAVDRQGRLQTWKAPVEDTGPWSSTGLCVPCQGIVRQAVLSPDAGYMAVSCAGQVQIFTAMAAGDWQRQYSCPWRQAFLDDNGQRPFLQSPDWLLLSAQGQHLLLIDTQGLRACHRSADRWEEVPVDQAAIPLPSRGSLNAVELDADSRLLIVAAWADWTADDQLQGQVGLWLWRFEPGYGWRQRHRRQVSAPGIQRLRRLAMALHPEGQQWAVPEYDKGTTHLCVLSATPADDWSLAQRLTFEPAGSASAPAVMRFVQFAATGRYLVAAAVAGLHIFRHHPDQGWSSLLWIVNSVPAWVPDIRVALSPDGCHLALAMAASGQISIWGLDRRGSYIQKAHTDLAAAVDALLFSPDGNGLVLCSWRPGPAADEGQGRLISWPLVPAV